MAPLLSRRIAPLVAAAALLAGCGSSSGSSSSSTSSTAAATQQTSSTPSQTPQLLAPNTTAAGPTIDGIRCDTQEQVVYHVHSHLAVYVNGAPRIIPQGIGIAPPYQEEQSVEGPFVVSGTCFYWLHAHTPDGIIHIESPNQHIYTLGQYFDIWQQPLGASQVGPATGRVTAYVDGKPYGGNPRNIPLVAHELIQLDVGTPTVPPQGFTFPSGD